MRTPPGHLRKIYLVAVLSTCYLAVAGAAGAETALAIHLIDIPSQAASEALQLFVAQTQYQLIYSPDLLRGVKTTAVKGSMSSREALGRMLKGTGIEIVDTGEGAATLRLAKLGSAETAADGDQDVLAVIVSSRKFNERVIDVPIAVSVFSNEALKRRGATSISDVLQDAPGVAVYDGGNGLSKISIRGISSSLGGNENGYYLDDLPFTGVTVPISPDIRAWDLERVEVLRGPQGTLFGEGSMGGTVRTLTRNARINEFSFAGQTGKSWTEGGGTSDSAKAMINIPVIQDMLAIRVAMTDEHMGGWVDDPADGKRDINPSAVKTTRLRARFDPLENLTINASYWKYQGAYQANNIENDAGNAATGIRLNGSTDYTLKGISGTYDFDKASLFYAYANNDFQLGQAGTYLGGAISVPIGINVVSHELRLSSDDDKHFKWTTGLYRRAAKRNDDLQWAQFGINQQSATDSVAYSVFGEITYTLPTFPLEISGGIRHFKDHLTGHDVNSGVASPAVDNTFSSNNPRLSLAYRPQEDWQIYTSASKGFRSGQNQITGITALAAQYGVHLPSALKPDSIWTYELGTKVALLNRRLNLELAVYHSDWKDVTVRLPIGNTGFNGLINSDGTKTNGIDANASYDISKQWSVSAGGGLVDARYAGTVEGTGIKDGSRVDDVPRYTLSLSSDLRFDLSRAWSANLNLGLQHASAHPSSTFPSYLPGDPIDNVHARIGLVNGPWTISLFGENLTNDRGATSYRSFNQLSATESEMTSPRLRPRTIGLELNYALGK